MTKSYLFRNQIKFLYPNYKSCCSKSEIMYENMDLKVDILSIIPPLLQESHKGESGRIGVIGGSKDFTGAPYYAGISALKVGCDLAHVFCVKEAAQAIKSYNPELIVHPILDSPHFAEEMSTYLPSLHSLVIGPGLGKEESIFHSTRHLIDLAKKKDIPMVFDADSLFYLNNSYEEIFSYKKAILTPNVIEFKRLYEAVLDRNLDKNASMLEVKELAQALGNVTIVNKGKVDIISNGIYAITCEEEGSARRCGGQGDILAGSLGVFNFWAHQMAKPENIYPPTIQAALLACMLTRRCNRLAFKKFQRSTLTTDMLNEIHTAFSSFLK